MGRRPPAGSRAEQIFRDFCQFHRDNPKVYELFERFTFAVIKAGHKTYSADAICHRIRWWRDVETRAAESDGSDKFKINNNYVAYYARLFMYRNPSHAGFFRVRVRRSEGYSSYDGPYFRDPDDPEWFSEKEQPEDESDRTIET